MRISMYSVLRPLDKDIDKGFCKLSIVYGGFDILCLPHYGASDIRYVKSPEGRGRGDTLIGA